MNDRNILNNNEDPEELKEWKRSIKQGIFQNLDECDDVTIEERKQLKIILNHFFDDFCGCASAGCIEIAKELPVIKHSDLMGDMLHRILIGILFSFIRRVLSEEKIILKRKIIDG